MSFDLRRSRFPGAIVWGATWGEIDQTVTNDESHAQRWRGETPCNRMQIQATSIDVDLDAARAVVALVIAPSKRLNSRSPTTCTFHRSSAEAALPEGGEVRVYEELGP